MPRKRKQPSSTQSDTSSSDRKTKKQKVEKTEDKPLKTKNKGLGASLSTGSGDGAMFVGAHVSAAGGVHNAVANAVRIGCKSFALFLKSQRQWNAKPLDPQVIAKFKEAIKENGFQPHLILPHGSYLVNCGSPSPETFAKSKKGLIEELQRAEMLGLTLYNFHPGSTCGQQTVEKSIQQIAECINSAHVETEHITPVLENMSCQGNTLGGKFEELASIIEKVKDKSRIGVCLDTCHAFAAGFDLRTEEGYADMMEKFDKLVGFHYLKGMHLNDSKGELGCHLDRHELIGKGKIGAKAFKRIMNDRRLENIPLILETPDPESWEKEIKLLYSMVEP